MSTIAPKIHILTIKLILVVIYRKQMDYMFSINQPVRNKRLTNFEIISKTAIFM